MLGRAVGAAALERELVERDTQSSNGHTECYGSWVLDMTLHWKGQGSVVFRV